MCWTDYSTVSRALTPRGCITISVISIAKDESSGRYLNVSPRCIVGKGLTMSTGLLQMCVGVEWR